MISGVNRYYETLGLWPGASLDDVRRAYRDLVQVWHPDRFAHNPELQNKAQEKLKEINESYAGLRSHRSTAGDKARDRKARVQGKVTTKKYASSQRSESFRKKRKKALVVENEPESRRALRDFFAAMGYHVVEAHGRDEIISVYVQDRPDMVFLGAREQGEEGLDTLRRLKTINPEAAVIMASEALNREIEEKPKAKGTIYINKPINYNYLGLAMKTDFRLNGGVVDITV